MAKHHSTREERDAFKRGFAEATCARESDVVPRFLAYLDRQQSKAEEILRKAGYRDPSALIRDPLTRRSRFSCSAGQPGAIDLVDLPSAVGGRGGRRKPESSAFELLGWVYETRGLIERTPHEWRESLIQAVWLGCNIGAVKIGVRQPEIREVLESWKNEDAARKRRGTKAPLRLAVERISEGSPGLTLPTLLEVFENEDSINELREARTEPIDIEVQEVRHDEKMVYYRTRAGEKSVKFTTLERLIRDIKTKK